MLKLTVKSIHNLVPLALALIHAYLIKRILAIHKLPRKLADTSLLSDLVDLFVYIRLCDFDVRLDPVVLVSAIVLAKAR